MFSLTCSHTSTHWNDLRYQNSGSCRKRTRSQWAPRGHSLDSCPWRGCCQCWCRCGRRPPGTGACWSGPAASPSHDECQTMKHSQLPGAPPLVLVIVLSASTCCDKLWRNKQSQCPNQLLLLRTLRINRRISLPHCVVEPGRLLAHRNIKTMDQRNIPRDLWTVLWWPHLTPAHAVSTDKLLQPTFSLIF